jgi:acetyl-CoA C-acetyltransferase
MAIDPRLPVLVGVGQVSHRAEGLDDARSPISLMAGATRAALDDTGCASKIRDVDAIRVVQLLSWRYRDPARFLAHELSLASREFGYTTPGGNTPQMLVNLTAGQIQRGELDIALLTGGEAWRSRMRARKAGVELWNAVDESLEPDLVHGADVAMSAPAERDRGIQMPVQMYPMFETAIRAAAGETIDSHRLRIAALWAKFASVARDNPYAWVRSSPTAEQIATAGPSNRMIGFPYSKMMNSNNDVDQAATVVMCSAGKAEALGIPRDKWVFIHSGTDCHEHLFVSHRNTFAETPAIRIGGRRALELAGIGIDDVSLVDLYSCFPSAVQLGAASLGLSLDRQLTRTGGLSFAGGPWNNYVMHAIATMVADVRRAPGEYGLVWANGGYATKHAFGVYSTNPPSSGFRHDKPQAAIDALPKRVVADASDAAGGATIEAYTVMHDRDGVPEAAHAAVLLADGRRAWATSRRIDTAAALCEGEWVGRAVAVRNDGELVTA